MTGHAGSSADKLLGLLLHVLIVTLFIFPDDLRAEDVLLTVNVKKPVALTSDKFLSYTLDPTVVLTSDALTKNSERSVNMAKALAPAYVRIGGPRSNSYTFERTHRSQGEEDTGFTFTEANWIDAHRWANNAGLDVLACIAPQHSESGGRDPGWDSRNALDLISFSDHMGFNTSWQLGYECQTRCDVAGIDIGRDVMRLRSMLDAFPRYSRSVIAGPDVVTYRTKQQQQYLQDYLSVAGTALSAITWHPDFASITLDTEGVSMHHDNLALDRDSLYRVVGRLISKKPLWLAESKPEECKRQFLGALVWTRRLGNAAKLGVQVLMRQPSDSNLFQPTPDYWVSVLHKNLVGREVLDTKIATGNRTHVHFYCQCTKPSSKYEKGSLTIFGINLTPAKVVANLKGVKIKTLHKYILLPGFDAENRMFSETVLLNNEPLTLLNESELPEIKPAISSNSKGVTLKLPSGGIGFWVVPGLKIKSCGGLDEDNSDKMLLKKLTKRLDVAESDEESANEEDREDYEDDENISVEERRYSTVKSGKEKRRRKHRFSEEDDAEKRYRKIEAKMDLERLEKLLRRRDSHDERKLPRGRTAYFGFEERSQEKMHDDDDDETGEEIRAKLEEYKNRLKDYENRKRNEAKSRDRSKVIESSDGEMIDSEKVVEALSLISKMEKSMKSFDRGNDESPIDTLNPSVPYDVTSDLMSPGDNRNPEDTFLDELLKSQKIKRTSIPSQIEVQLRAIYQMLAEEKERRQQNLAVLPKTDAPKHVEEQLQEIVEPPQEIDASLRRIRRDTDKKFGDDPLGLRKEGLFRRRTKNEDVRDRRYDRRTRRKDKDDRKEGQPVIFDPRQTADSNENNFYGFHQREPLKGFPEGDVFLNTGTSSEETAKDYDYVKDDDETQDQEKPRKAPQTSEPARGQTDPDDMTWVEDENTQLDHVPHEFFEDVKMAVPRVHENLKEYGELWEAESLGETMGDGQDHFNAGDEEATVEKILQERRPDAHEDRRAKETAVQKLIGYYENPRSPQEEETDYFIPEKSDKPRNGARNSPRSNPMEMRNKKSAQESPAMRKRVKDLASSEFGGFTDFGSMHFSRAGASSAEEEPLYAAGFPAARPAPRAKRSVDDLETILNQEMIFQDDNNLKDCECRVIRGAKTSRRRGDRERGERRSRVGKSERGRKQKNRDGPPSSGPGGRFDEDYMHSTRRKRQTDTIEEILEGSMDAEPHVSVEYSGSEESGSPVEEDESDGISGDTIEYVENPNSRASPEALDSLEGVVEIDEGPEEEVDDGLEESGDLTVEEKNAELAVEHEFEDLENDNIVKRHDQAGTQVADEAEGVDAEGAEETESAVAEIVGASMTKDLAEPEVPMEESAKDSEADKFFLGSEATNVEESSTAITESPAAEAASATRSVDESIQNLQTSPSEDKGNSTGGNANGAEAKIADDTTAASTDSSQGAEETNDPTEQGNGEDSETGATEDPSVEPETDGLVKLEDEESTATDVSITANKTTSANKKDAVKSLKLPKDSPRPPRKVQKTKQTVKVVDPAKARELRMAARSEALAALRKENEARKAKKSMENTSRILSSESAKFQAMQKKRVEQLEKLRDKLRTKRAKMVQEYRDELMDELDKAGTGEERNLKRREIIEMINHDEELRHIVDREKLDYLMLNKPIDYETVKNEYRVQNAEPRKKYVPEAVDIVKPLHEARERKVQMPSRTVALSSDPNILAYPSPESTNSGAIRRTVRERFEPTEYKINCRSGRTYHGVVESLENPQVIEYPHSDEYESGEDESDGAAADKSPIDSNYSARLVRNTSSGKNRYMCPITKSDENSNESREKLSGDLIQEKNRYATQDSKFNNDKKYISKKKYLRESDYELNSKYKSPKYARLSPEKMEIEREKLKNSRKNIDEYQHKSLSDDNEDWLQQIRPHGSRKVKEVNDENEAEMWSDEWMKQDQEQNQSDLEVISDLDLDEALNSSKYELLMLIPVKKPKKSRPRRHAGNEIFRDLEDSTSNEISVEMNSKSKAIDPLLQQLLIDESPNTATNHSEDSSQSTESTNSDESDKTADSIFESSTVSIVDSSSTPDASLDGYWVEEIVRSVPRVAMDVELRDDKGLPGLLEEAIPKLEATVTGGLGKARRISESFEKFVDGFEGRFNRKQLDFEKEHPESIESSSITAIVPISSNIFSTATTNVKKFFDFVSGMIHVFRFI